jgi:hypothetical protein
LEADAEAVVGVEGLVDDVGQAPFEGAHGVAVGLAGGFLAVEVGAAGAAAGLDECDSVDGFVEPAVAGAVEAVAVGAAAADWDGGGAVAAGVGVAVAEAGDVSGLAEQPSGGQRSDAVDVEQGCLAVRPVR